MLRRLLLALLLASIPLAAGAAEKGLPLPRFAALKFNEVNLRVGPGKKYPIDWVLKRKDMPVEILEEFETYRKIRDWEGTVGWVSQTALSGRRSVIVQGEIRAVRLKAEPGAPVVAHAEPGVIGKLLECPAGDWCRVELDDVRGWLPRKEIWGVYPTETIP